MPDVVVLYGGLSLVRVPWDEKDMLVTDGVLSIAIVHSDPKNLNKRRQAVCEYDYYVLAWGDNSSYLGGYDDDFYWFSLTEPWKPHGEGFVHRFPYILPENSILFEGVMVDKEVYAGAKRIFSDRDGGMY